jgi:transposase-like protein
LYKWRQEARQKGILLPNADAEPSGWTARDKFSAVIETAGMNETELAEYCRKKGIYPEQVVQWRQACESANDWDRQVNNKLKVSLRDDRKRIKQLEKELIRKEKALAEAAALLVLQKKVQAIWGDPEDE